jgi:predicted ester cyclase
MPKVRAALPDAQWSVEELLSDGDKVVSRVRFRGTHRGVLDTTMHGVNLAVPPTGKVVEFFGVGIDRVANGKIVDQQFLEQPTVLRHAARRDAHVGPIAA